MIEMLNRRPLFQGSSDIDQLYRIFQSLGTPSPVTWPGMERLKNYNPSFPQWPCHSITSWVPSLDVVGADLLQQMLVYAPSKRISAKDALNHPWFSASSDVQR